MISLTRPQYLESIQKLRDTATGLCSSLTETQLSWQPGGGARWSVLECLDHITLFNASYLGAIEAAASNASPGKNAGEFRSAGMFSEKFVAFGEPPARAKVKAPGKIQPRPTLNSEKILPEFLKSMDRVSAFVESTANKDLNTVRFANPLIPLVRFTAGTGMLTIGAHSRRHLWQAQEVLKEADFPR